MNDERVCNCLIDEDVIDMRDCPIHDGDTCEQCGREVLGSEAVVEGHHTFCSWQCLGRCVGVPL